MTLLKQERAGAENHITTLGGDLLSPSVMSGLTKCAQMVAVMNAIGLDYAGLANHEFDFGDDGDGRHREDGGRLAEVGRAHQDAVAFPV